jgi:hypothetical protein
MILKTWKKNNWTQGLYKSYKSSRVQRFQSSWELQLFQILDESSIVSSWDSEVVAIPYYYRGKWRRYLPDILINKRLLIEIKPTHQIKYPMNQAKFKAAVEYCKKKGWKFLILNKNLIEKRAYLQEEIIRNN